MKKKPYMPLFISDYEGDTAHLSLIEDGAYNRLLRLCWKTPGCSIPNDDVWIRRHMRVSQDEFDSVVKPILNEFFRVARGRYYNKKQKEVLAKAKSVSASRSSNGKKGGRPSKSMKDNDLGKSKPKAKQNHPKPKPSIVKEDTNVSSKTPKKSSSKKRKTALPDGWRPKPLSAALKSKLQLTQEEYRHEFDKFTESARAHGRSYVDWDAAWRTWLQSPYGTWGKRQEAGGTGGKPKTHNDRMAENDQRRWDAWDRASGPDQGYEQTAEDVGGAHDASRIA